MNGGGSRRIRTSIALRHLIYSQVEYQFSLLPDWVAQAGLEPAERAYQARMFTSYITAHQIIWRERQDSNLQLPVLETGTLPD